MRPSRTVPQAGRKRWSEAGNGGEFFWDDGSGLSRSYSNKSFAIVRQPRENREERHLMASSVPPKRELGILIGKWAMRTAWYKKGVCFGTHKRVTPFMCVAIGLSSRIARASKLRSSRTQERTRRSVLVTGDGSRSNRSKGMLKSIDVWQRVGDGRLVRYRCFEVLSTGRFCVQSCDFYGEKVSPEYIAELEANFLELLAEEEPDSRSPTFPTLEEAIANHRNEFLNDI